MRKYGKYFSQILIFAKLDLYMIGLDRICLELDTGHARQVDLCSSRPRLERKAHARPSPRAWMGYARPKFQSTFQIFYTWLKT